jgi:gamma-glutamyltranspeptidase/glutathione hydrolase
MRWHAHFEEVTTTGGMVTAADELAAEAGAAVLRAGGNAVDAAVATAFALGVVEPEMSGLGGGTLLTIRMGDERVVIDGGISSPAAATADQFPLAEQPGAKDWAVSFYDWPAVVGAANVLGPRAVGVPGTVATLLLAHERWGVLPRADVLAPAIALAADGFEINWFLAALIASNARGLGRDPGCAEVFLRGGLPLRGPDVRRSQVLVQPKLAESLAAIAADGAAAFYGGPIGASIAAVLRAGGGLVTEADIAGYEPAVEEAASVTIGDLELLGPAVSGFPSVVQVLELHEAASRRGIADDVVRWALASKVAMVDRVLHMSADPDDETPWDVLQSPAYADARLEAELSGAAPPDPHLLGAGSFTSHHSVIDADGNAVSATQTVLNTFGARVLDPATGVLLNDGMAYFDPTPGARNGIRPSTRAFSAMSPIVALRDGQVAASYGASGGRRIITGVAQITKALAAGRSMQEAVEEPRVYAESEVALVDRCWPGEVGPPLEAAGFTVEITEEQPTTVHFARPNGILVDVDGVRRSGVDPKKPGAAAVAEEAP